MRPRMSHDGAATSSHAAAVDDHRPLLCARCGRCILARVPALGPYCGQCAEVMRARRGPVLSGMWPHLSLIDGGVRVALPVKGERPS